MKMRIVNNLFKLTWLVLLGSMVLVSCKEDDPVEDPPVIILDGYYIVGPGTGLSTKVDAGLMSVARNEVTQEDRAQLMEKYVAVQGGSEAFNIVMVSGSSTKTYGPGADFAMVAEADLDLDEPKAGLWRGTLEETTTMFTVPDDGLYHIAFDSELMIVVMAKVDWGLIGGATPGGWTDDTPLVTAGFDLNTMTYEIAEVPITEDTWKFRYSGGWKIILDADADVGNVDAGVKVNCNFGGAVDALEAGGADIANATYANYKVGMTWTLGAAYAAEFTYVSDAEPLPTFPEAMYIVGDATSYGWDAPGTHVDAIMHKCAGGAPLEGVYWKICHIEGGLGFKVSAENWGEPNLGFAQVDEYDTEGVTVIDAGDNMGVEASGMYMIVLDLREDMTKISIKEAEVYGMGDTFGGWDEDVPANLFTIDVAAKTLTSPALVADGNVRMYAQHPWIQDWWNAEFNVFSGVIEYRNDGGDQEAVAGTTGQVVTLMFDDNTGTIN